MKHLLKLRGAIPFLAVVFLNALVDLGHKITIQNTIFKIYDGTEQVVLTAIVNGLILLPFILLFSPAGFINDRYPKRHIIRKATAVAVVLSCAISVCYYQGWFWPAFAMTFLLAVQSAIYSPAKYGLIKPLFGKKHLAEANGLVQSVTIIAILMSTFLFSIIFEQRFPAGSTDPAQILKAIAPIGGLLIINSLFELILAYRLPATDDEPVPTNEVFSLRNYFTGVSVRKNIQPLLGNATIKLSVIGLAVFWSIGQVLLATFPAFAKASLAIDNTIIIQGMLAATGIGIALGALIAAKSSKGYIETGLIPIAAMGICGSLLLLTQLSSPITHTLNLLFLGIMGGIFIVPLNALIQFNAKSEESGKILAGNNLIQNLAMLSFLLITVAFALKGFSSKNLLILTSIVAFIGTAYTCYKLPQSLVRLLLTMAMTRRYKVKVQGFHNLPAQGGVLLLGNHISWIDWAIIQIASPRPVRFVMHKSIYERWYLKHFLNLFGVIPIASGASSRKTLSQVADLLNGGEVVCLFPEGSISRSGHLGEFKRGYEKACAQCNDDIVIVPFYLRGLWGSRFSRSSDQLKTLRSSGRYRDLIVGFGAPLSKDTPADVLKRKVFDVSIDSWQSYTESLHSLPHAWINTVKTTGSDLAIADTIGSTLSARQALSASIAFSKRIKKHSPEQNIGLLLPTSAGGMLANMAVLLAGKTVVNLNYSASEEALLSAIEQASINTIYTSKKFIEKLKRKGLDLSGVLNKTKVIFLEDLRAGIGKAEMLRIWLMIMILPATVLRGLFCQSNNIDQTAAILFSSGSEGLPKGVLLSHRNIMANLKQISDMLNTRSDDVMMASLPLFHAFGLTVTQFMPLIEGIPIVCHPDPSDVVNIAKSIAKYQATLIFGTSTFLRLYTQNRKVHPLMLDSLRVVIAGAERLKPEVRAAFETKFNKTIYEGYGATETTPVASVNLPDALDTDNWHVQQGSKMGTVGLPLPGTSFKIVDPDSLQELATGDAGMILIGGAQVMQGYLKQPEKTEQAIKLIDGIRWYITGDKGLLDEDGFLKIIDRYSRFAKIGGEMISLSVIESKLRQLINNESIDILALNMPDEKKGEKIIILSTAELDGTDLKKALLATGANPLGLPAQFFTVEAIPVLGSGKTDFNQAKLLTSQLLSV